MAGASGVWGAYEEALKRFHEVLPKLLDKRAAHETVRSWVPGGATGEQYVKFPDCNLYYGTNFAPYGVVTYIFLSLSTLT
jgi:hypothetical protein